MLALSDFAFPVVGRISSQTASRFSRCRPSIHCNGTEKLPPPSRYFAANPQPRKTVTPPDSQVLTFAQAIGCREPKFELGLLVCLGKQPGNDRQQTQHDQAENAPENI